MAGMLVLHELKVYIFIKPSQAAQAGHTHNGGNILCLFSWPLQIHQSQPCLSVVTPQFCRLPSLQFPMANCQYCDCFILSHILQSVSGFTVSI